MKWLLAGFLLLALSVAGSGPAVAQGVLVDKSEIRFVSKQMGVNVEGRFRKWKANILFLPKDLAKSRVEMEIEIASIDLASEDSEKEVRDRVWFDTARFPVARYVSSSLKEVGPDRYEVAGQLTIKGIAKDVVVPLSLRKDAAGNATAEGSFTIKRLDFKIGEGQWADTDMVANDVLVRFRMALAPVR
jgi:polyisoprenoid-binding protein YceI